MLGTMWWVGVRPPPFWIHTPFLENSNLLNAIHAVQIHVLEKATNQLESKVTHVSHVASSNYHPNRGVGVVIEILVTRMLGLLSFFL